MAAINSENLYGSLDETIKDGLNLKPLDVSASKLIKDFVEKTLPDQHEKHINNLRHKPLMLDLFKKPKIKKKSRSIGLSAKEKRSLSLYKLPKEKQKYENFIPLHMLWKDYMEMLLGMKQNDNLTLQMVENKLLKADYHGSILKVTRSKCNTYLDITGIMIKETRNMFYLITEDNKMKGIPKANSLFEFRLGDYVFEIFGSNFRFRAGERSARKFKPKPFMMF